jgi:hypothetical protein
LYTSGEAATFYTRLCPSVNVLDCYMKWANACALLETLAERATACTAHTPSFWFRTYTAYAHFMRTGTNRAIADRALVSAARSASVDDAVHILQHSHADFVAFVHAHPALDIPELDARAGSDRSCRLCRRDRACTCAMHLQQPC